MVSQMVGSVAGGTTNHFVMEDEDKVVYASDQRSISQGSGCRSPDDGDARDGAIRAGGAPEPQASKRKRSSNIEDAFKTEKAGWVPSHMKEAGVGGASTVPANRLNKSGIELNSIGNEDL